MHGTSSTEDGFRSGPDLQQLKGNAPKAHSSKHTPDQHSAKSTFIYNSEDDGCLESPAEPKYDNSEIAVTVELPGHTRRKFQCKRPDLLGLLFIKLQPCGWDMDKYALSEQEDSSELTAHLRLQDLGIFDGQVLVLQPCDKPLEPPNDASQITVTVKLPYKQESDFKFNRSDRIGLLFLRLEVQGWDMNKHFLRRKDEPTELIDYLRFQDEGVTHGQLLIVERRANPLKRVVHP